MELVNYNKHTKDTIDFPSYVSSFPNKLIGKMETYGMIGDNPNRMFKNPSATITIPLVSRRYPYCFDAIELIKKTIKRRGFNCELPRYVVNKIDNPNNTKSDAYSYEFKITNIN